MKKIAILLAVVLLMGSFPLAVSANTPLDTLTSVEVLLYGEAQTGALLERIDRVERDIYGETQTGAVLIRIDRVQGFLNQNQGNSTSLQLQLNLAEWGFLARLTDGQPLVKRLERLEVDLIGTPLSGPIATRTSELMNMIWGTTKLDVKAVDLKGQSLVRIRMVSDVDSAKNREGEVVRYRVVDDVMVDGRVVIPAGAEGTGRISEVTTAGRMGRDGRVLIDFGSVPALDGSRVSLRVDEKATEKNKSIELAAGASMAGVLLLGPVGLVGGYFVKGQDVKIPMGTEFYLETERALRVSGFLLRPAQ